MKVLKTATTMTNRVYGFCGRKRSGKGVLAEIVKEKYDGVIVTVANYLKFICCDILGCTIEELNSKKDDGTTFSLFPNEKWYEIIYKKTGISIEDIQQDISGIEFTTIRQMLQIIGTDCIRKHKENWHTECMVEDLKKYIAEGKTVAVDDVRFPNERKAIEELGGECFFIMRPLNENVSNHISETSLTWDMFDEKHIIINEYSLAKFKRDFEWHLDNGFKNSIKHNLFLSEKKWHKDLNTDFGKEKTSLVEKILEQVRHKEDFLKDGVINIFVKDPETHKMISREIFGDNAEEDIKNAPCMYLFYNPLINENLKAYL